jgi:hypothetical protein
LIFQKTLAHLFVFQLTNFKINIGETPLGLISVTKAAPWTASRAMRRRGLPLRRPAPIGKAVDEYRNG